MSTDDTSLAQCINDGKEWVCKRIRHGLQRCQDQIRNLLLQRLLGGCRFLFRNVSETEVVLQKRDMRELVVVGVVKPFDKPEHHLRTRPWEAVRPFAP